jgi:hypothetical protein
VWGHGSHKRPILYVYIYAGDAAINVNVDVAAGEEGLGGAGADVGGVGTAEHAGTKGALIAP